MQLLFSQNYGFYKLMKSTLWSCFSAQRSKYINIEIYLNDTYRISLSIQVHLNKLDVVEKFIYFSNSTQIVKLVY